MKCSPPRISTSLIYLLLASFCQAVPWTNNDGKVIEADFVRLDGEKVLLRMNDKEFQVPLVSLSKNSQAFARYMQEQRVKWATANASSPIISEQILQEITAFSGELTEGKSYLVEGLVKSIRGSGSSLDKKRDSSTAMVELTLGTKAEVDFTGQVNNSSTKIKLEDGKVFKMKANVFSSNGYSDFNPSGILMQNGQKIVLRATVMKGQIVVSGFASEAEITEAKLLLAKQNGGLQLEEVVALENIKNRIEYLEGQIKGGTLMTGRINSNEGGTVGSVNLTYTNEQKAAMIKELELLRAQISAAAK